MNFARKLTNLRKMMCWRLFNKKALTAVRCCLEDKALEAVATFSRVFPKSIDSCKVLP